MRAVIEACHCIFISNTVVLTILNQSTLGTRLRCKGKSILSVRLVSLKFINNFKSFLLYKELTASQLGYVYGVGKSRYTVVHMEEDMQLIIVTVAL